MKSPFLSSEEFDEQAHGFYEAGDYDAALELLREGLTFHPESVLLHVGIGYVRVARDEYAWARQCFERALELDVEYEDAWVGLGETLLKFGRVEEALRCFTRIDEMGLAEDLELGLTIGRALYREGLFADARQRFNTLSPLHPASAELAAARGYTLHALGDDLGARRELRRAIRLDPELHEARIYLSHLLHDRGDTASALRELESVPPAEHWDTLSLWRYIELKTTLDGTADDDPLFVPWRERLAELDAEPDEIDHLLAEVEAAFEGAVDESAQAALELSAQLDFIMKMLAPGAARRTARETGAHRVRTTEGSVFEGTWEEIVEAIRVASADGPDPLAAFLARAELQMEARIGSDDAATTAEACVRASARAGLLSIEE